MAHLSAQPIGFYSLSQVGLGDFLAGGSLWEAVNPPTDTISGSEDSPWNQPGTGTTVTGEDGDC